MPGVQDGTLKQPTEGGPQARNLMAGRNYFID